MRDFRHPWLWLGIWCAALAATLVVCLVPLPAMDAPVLRFDKLHHALGHALLAAWAAMLFMDRRTLLLAIAGLLLFGVAIEGLQALLPWRSAELLDIAANALGVALGAAIAATPVARTLLHVERLVARSREASGAGKDKP
jgi:VanZ family protein